MIVGRKRGRKPSTNGRAECTTCGKTFRQSGSLVIHMRSHSGARPYPCAICGKASTTADNLSKHMRTHTGARDYACKICGKAFTQSSSVT